MSGVNIPTSSNHLSDLARSELIEEFNGMVDSQFTMLSQMRRFVPVSSITGTDTKIVRRASRTDLQKVTPGVRPAANAQTYGRTSVTVDTVILARANESLIGPFQQDFSVRAEVAKDHGKELGKFFDEAFFIQAIKSSKLAAPTGLNGAIGAGKNQTLAAANDEKDPDKLYAAVETIITEMQEEEIDTDECMIFLRPQEYQVLLNHDKLINRDYSMANGDFADATLKTVDGCPVMKSVRIPTKAITSHKLSNEENNFAYDLSAADAKAAAVIMHPMSLLAGETIPMTTNIHWNETELQWFIDAYMAFGVSNRRPDVCGTVFTA